MRFIFFVLFLFPGLALSSDDLFKNDIGKFFSSAQSACNSYIGQAPRNCPSCKFVSFEVTEGPGSFMCLGTYHFNSGGNAGPPVKYKYVSRVSSGCSDYEFYDFELQQCRPKEPDPDQCEAGNEVSHWKFFGKNTLYNIPPTACLVGCRYNHTSSTPCMGPVESNGAVGNSCKLTYTGTGEECSGGNDSPPDDEPPGPEAEENPDCKKFTNVDGSWGFDCSPKPDPDEENNSCPPGYMMQGDTCFRIPPEHPDYDPDKDPENPGNGDGGNGGNNGEGDENGDWAKESTLQGIDKTLKGIDKTGKAIESAMKTGNATTHDLLSGIKDAIGNIPGGGGGNGNGGGEEEGGSEYKPGEGDSVCEAKPECSGDVIQCGIVDQQWRTRCEFEKAYDYEGNKDKIEGLLEGEKFELLESGDPVEVPSFLNMHARWLGSSSCPSDETISLRTGGGRTFSLSYEPLCTAATTISPLLIIIATVLATLYIGRGSEG